MRLLMLFQVVAPHKPATALLTGVGLLPGVRSYVSVEVVLPLEPLLTLPAVERPILNELGHPIRAGSVRRR